MTARILITGSRDFGSTQQDQATQKLYNLKARRMIERTLDKYVQADHHMLICGGARGADWWAIKWALANETTVLVMPARWSKHGKGAGLTRNENMLIEGRPALVVGFWNGRSNGARHMLEFADRRGTRTMTFHLTLDWLADNTEFPEPECNY
jgi:hypothetical protein